MKQFFLLLLSLVPFLGQTQNAFPSYDDVALRFFVKNPTAFSQMDEGLNIRLAKSPSGWAAIREKYNESTNDYEEVGRDQIWTAGTQQWDKNYASLPAKIDRNTEEDTYYWSLDHERNFYTENYFYGYPLWFKDVIDALADRPNLTALEYYQLGRAYSTSAIQLNVDLSYQKAYRSYNTEYDKSFDVSALPKAYSYKIMELADKAIASFEKAKKLDPKLQTIVGSIDLKLQHERLTWYQEFAMMGLADFGRKYLDAANYDPLVLAYAQDMLSSCPQNALLITNGDTDTYPLIYLQAKKGFRSDVILVNKSLAALPRYMNYVLQNPNAANLRVNLQPKFYSARGLNYFLKGPNTEILSDGAFFKTLFQSPVETKPSEYLNLPASTMTLALGDEYLATDYHTCPDARLEFNLSNVYYPLSTIFILDLLTSNTQTLKICATPGGWEQNLVPDEKWMSLGMVKVLVPCTSPKAAMVSSDLFSSFSFPYPNVSATNKPEDLVFLNAFLVAWYETLSVAYKNKNEEVVEKITNKLSQNIPVETLIKGNFTQLALLMAYMNKDATKTFAESLCKSYAQHLLDELESWKTSIANKEKPAMEFRTQIQSRLNTIAWIKEFYPEFQSFFKSDMLKLYSQI
jgi:hypothetical protein